MSEDIKQLINNDIITCYYHNTDKLDLLLYIIQQSYYKNDYLDIVIQMINVIYSG
jgi:hypothetical protein